MLLITGAKSSNCQEKTTLLSLKEACDLALKNNIAVKSADIDLQISRFRVKEVKSRLYPQLEAYSNFSHYFAIPKMIVPGEIFGQTGLIPVEIGTKFDWQSGFKASQILFSKSYFTSIAMANQMQELSKLNLEQQREEIIYQVSKMWLLCRNIEMQRECIGENLANLKRIAEVINLQSENGVVRKTDYSRVLVNIDNVQTEYEGVQELLMQQLRVLKYLIGMAINENVKLAGDLPGKYTIESQNSIDISDRTAIKAIDKQIVISELAIKAKRQEYLPSLAAFGQYYYQGQRNSFDYFKGGGDKFYKVGVVGIGLTIPIFDGREKHNKLAQNYLEQTKLENLKLNTTELLKRDIEDAYGNYTTSSAAVERQRRSVTLAEESYSISLNGYKEGIFTLSDLLLSQNSLSEAKLSYFNSLIKFNEAILDYKRAKGVLFSY